MRRLATFTLLALAVLTPLFAWAQTPASAPATPPPTAVGTSVDKFMIQMYPRLRRFLVATVALMPDDGFSLRPSADARTFAEAVTHIGVSNYSQCRTAAGNPLTSDELATLRATPPTKAALTKLITDGLTLCDPVFASPGDDRAAQIRATLSVHSWEVYGSMAVYLRMKGLVPPSTEEERKSRGGGGLDHP